MRTIKSLLRLLMALLMAGALLLSGAESAFANHGDIHATCVGDVPVITSRPPGTEHIQVICVRGLPEFQVAPETVPTYDPVRQGGPMPIPPDFGGWVTVWTKTSKTPLIWYNVGSKALVRWFW